MNSYYHAKASAKKWGGIPDDYIEIHEFIDSSKRIIGDVRHRSMYHHTEGVWLCQRIFGRTITVGGEPSSEDDGSGILCIPEELELTEEQEDAFTQAIIESMSKPVQIVREPPPVPMIILRPRTREIPVRLIAELHIMQDLGWLPSPKDYIDNMELKTWMGGATVSEKKLSDVFPTTKDDVPAPHTQIRKQPSEAYFDVPRDASFYNRPATPEPPPFVDPPPVPLIPDPNLIIDRISSSTPVPKKKKDPRCHYCGDPVLASSWNGTCGPNGCYNCPA